SRGRLIVRSDARGSFALQGIRSRAYVVAKIDAAGYLPNAVAGEFGAIASVPSAQVELSGDGHRELLLKLIRTASLSGRILDEFGDPVPEQRIQAYLRTN